jgi:hypothetical protein
MIRWLMSSAVAMALAGTAPAAAADAPTHPVDALTGAEINRSVEILTAAKRVDA